MRFKLGLSMLLCLAIGVSAPAFAQAHVDKVAIALLQKRLSSPNSLPSKEKHKHLMKKGKPMLPLKNKSQTGS